MAVITVKIIGSTTHAAGVEVEFEGYADGQLFLSQRINFGRASTPARIGQVIYEAARQAYGESVATPPDLSDLIGEALGEADVDPVLALDTEDLRTHRKRQLQEAANTYLERKPDGTVRYSSFMMLQMRDVRDQLDASLQAGQTLTTAQQALRDRLALLQDQFMAAVSQYFVAQSDAVEAADRAALQVMGFDLSHLEALDPDITMRELSEAMGA